MKQIKSRKKTNEVKEILNTLRLLGIDIESFNSMLDELPVTLWVHDENHKIVYGNRGFTESFGTCKNQTCHQCLMGEKEVCSCCPSKKTMENEPSEQCKLCKRGNSKYDLNIYHTPITNKDGRKYVLKSSLHIKDLTILAENHFSGIQNTDEDKNFLVMCASCKRIKDQNSNWVNVNTHIIESFKPRISHGICEECVGVLYPMLNIQDRQINVSTE